jgi:kinesin family member 5
LQNKLEAQYAAKREAHHSEILDLKQQLELKGNEVRSLNTTIDNLKGMNEELKVCFYRCVSIITSWAWVPIFQRAFAIASAGIEGGKTLAESAQDLERTRKAINVQLAEFDGVKKSLMRDLQNRCEKVGYDFMCLGHLRLFILCS